MNSNTPRGPVLVRLLFGRRRFLDPELEPILDLRDSGVSIVLGGPVWGEVCVCFFCSPKKNNRE